MPPAKRDDDGTAVTAVRAGHAIDEARLLSYLRDTFNLDGGGGGGRTLPNPVSLTVQQFSHGQSNPTYLCTVSPAAKAVRPSVMIGYGVMPRPVVGESSPSSPSPSAPPVSFVLRKKPSGPVIATAHAVEREYAVMDALRKRGRVRAPLAVSSAASSPSSSALVPFPVPRMLALEPTGTVLGSAFYLMEHVQGSVFADPTLPSLSRPQRRAVYTSALDTLVSLHSLSPGADLGLGAFGPPAGYYARQLKRLGEVSVAQAAHAAPLPRLEEALAWFRAHLPPDETALVHGDFKIDNLIYRFADTTTAAAATATSTTAPTPSSPSSSVPVVAAVLDWELSTLGHPLSDLANLCGAYAVPAASGGHGGNASAGMAGLLGAELGWDVSGVPTEEELVAAYCARTGRSFPLPAWPFCMAFWFLKYATIAQGVAARAKRGMASSAQAAAVGAMAPLLMGLCLDKIGLE
jgi:aminoglycoside phosphotransferase (APT) family kinase protein